MNINDVYGDCERLSADIVRIASQRGLTVSTAESCTAGMVTSFIGDVPGASAVLLGGVVTYCDSIKHRVLGVPSSTLRECTAVSAQTARAMARGSRGLFGSDIAVSVTGYAGPGGGTDDDPVGTVYFGLDSESGSTVERFTFEGGRSAVRLQSACAALRLIADELGADGGLKG